MGEIGKFIPKSGIICILHYCQPSIGHHIPDVCPQPFLKLSCPNGFVGNHLWGESSKSNEHISILINCYLSLLYFIELIKEYLLGLREELLIESCDEICPIEGSRRAESSCLRPPLVSKLDQTVHQELETIPTIMYIHRIKNLWSRSLLRIHGLGLTWGKKLDCIRKFHMLK